MSAAKTPNRRHRAGGSPRDVETRKAIFIAEYVRNRGNGTAAAIAAGYSDKGGGAAVAASRLLADPKVAAAVQDERDRLAKKYRLEGEDVVAELAAIALSDPRDLYDDEGRLLPPKQWPDHMARAVASIEHTKDGIKVRLWDKNSGIEKAMKHLGLFERDNKQKADQIAELMKHIATHQQGIPVKP